MIFQSFHFLSNNSIFIYQDKVIHHTSFLSTHEIANGADGRGHVRKMPHVLSFVRSDDVGAFEPDAAAAKQQKNPQQTNERQNEGA